jgi:hypothetical protein
MWNEFLDFCITLENGDKAGWVQAFGAISAIFASGLIASCQAKSQYKNSLNLQNIQDKNKELILTEAVVEIIKNSVARVRYVSDSLSTRQNVYDVANKLKYYDFEALNDIIESLKQIPLKDLPSAKLVTAVMTLISGIRQLDIQVDKTIAYYSKMDSADYEIFFTTLHQIKESTLKTYEESMNYLNQLK